MQQLIAGAKFPAKCVKNEIHNLLTTLRLTRQHTSAKEAQFHVESLRSFQRLFEELTYIHELHEFDTVAYLVPFLEVIQSDATDGQITAVALDAVDKFVSFGLIHPDNPRCMEAINTLAWGVINCRFVSSGFQNDEVVLLKMVSLLIDCLRCPAGEYLSDACVWHMVRKTFQISRGGRASHLLRSSAEGVLQQMVLTIFGTHKSRAHRVRVTKDGAAAPTPAAVAQAGGAIGSTAIAPTAAVAATASTASTASSLSLRVHRPYGFKAMHFVLRFLAFLLAFGRNAPAAAPGQEGAKGPGAKPRLRRRNSRSDSRSRSSSRERQPSDGEEDGSPQDLGLVDAPALDNEDLCIDMHCLGLKLLNVALESGGDEIAGSEELIGVIQDDICKSLLQNSRSESLLVFSLNLRAIFNLFLHFKRHLKVQLEIFFTSVHLKIAGSDAASYDQRELALESLLEFCREPELMLELYENYDCDVRCTNLFETLAKFLLSNSIPVAGGADKPRGGFTSLHRLALSGILSILHSISLRCETGRHFRAEPALAEPALGETDLQRKKEQKRRLAIGARTFNAEPSKSIAALGTLGLVSSPPTPESMAEFLRHTPALDMRAVGEYLANRKEFNGQVRKAFMDKFPFAGLGLTEAVRMLLSSFRLPGEAQLIERLMESFAEAYFTAQPAVLDSVGASGEASEGSPEATKPQDPLKTVRLVPREKNSEEALEASQGGPEHSAGEESMRVRMASSDTIFVLSYSIIMLNTDLHNKGVKKKMSIAEYVRSTRGIDNGGSLPEFFLTDIYEAIQDDEIRLFGDKAEGGETEAVVDDFFWEGILRRSESIDEFAATERLLSEAPAGETERDMFQVIMELKPLETLSQCYESVPDALVATQAMTGFQDLARISAYFQQAETVNNMVQVMCRYFCRASCSGALSARAQIALAASQQCVVHHHAIFREAEWAAVLDVLLHMWALAILPPHLTELDDFAGPDGRPLASLCDLRPPFPEPPEGQNPEVTGLVDGLDAGPSLVLEASPRDEGNQESDGFLESLTRWFEDEARDEDDPAEHRTSLGAHMSPRVRDESGEAAIHLPVPSVDPAVVHRQVKLFVARSGLAEIFTHTGITKLSAESLSVLAKALVQLSRPAQWGGGSSDSPARGEVALMADPAAAAWHKVADPVFALELLTNMTCMPLVYGNSLDAQIWPLVSTHFEWLLQQVIAGGGGSKHEQQFIERLIVNTLRLCIRLIGNAELVPTLLALTQHLARLPAGLFSKYSERIACGLLALVKEANLPHSGLAAIFDLLKRISEFPSNAGACNAGLEVLNYWLGDDQELSRLLSLQQFPELLSALQAFAMQNSTPASGIALGHLSSLVPQLARGARRLPEAHGTWQSLWVPTLHALGQIAREGAQKPSAEAFVYLQRLLLERDSELALPWEQVPFPVWKECLEQVLFPLLQAQPRQEHMTGGLSEEVAGARRASAAQLVCRVVLTHMPDWLRTSPDGFPVLFLHLLSILVIDAAAPNPSHEALAQSLKNLLLVISADPVFSELGSPRMGETLLEAAWGVVSPSLPELRREVTMILNPMAMEEEAAHPQAYGEAGDAQAAAP